MKFSLAIASAIIYAACIVGAGAKEVRVYNWSDYIAKDTVQKFEKETGIKVIYDVFDSNEVVEAKLLTGNTGYDVVVPTLGFMSRQVKAGVFAKLDKAALTNYGNLDPAMMKIVAKDDPDNAHGVPYAMFTTGLGYNADKVGKRLDEKVVGSWAMVFDPENAAKLADCGIAFLDSPSEVVAPALHYLGLDPNSEKAEDLAKAQELLEKVRPFIRYFHSSQYINDLAGGDICVAIGYSGDVLQARDRASEAGNGVKVVYTIPAEGGQVGFDMMAIPDDAPNPENALAFINFILKPEIAAGITNYVNYATPNVPAVEMVDEKVRTDPGVYPSEEIKAKLFSIRPHSAKFDRLLTRAWTTIKTSR